MTESSWPFDNADTSEAQYSTLLTKAVDTGVVGSPATSDLKLYADSSGMFVKLPAGLAVVQGFVYRNDSLLTLAVDPASSTARVDSVVLREDPAANSVRAVYKTGSATPPALTQTDGGVWETRIADVSVAANATTVPAGSVTDRRSYASQPWGEWTTDQRPNAATRGKAGFNHTTGAPEYFDGSGWRSFSTTTTDAGNLVSGTLANGRLDYGVLAAVRGDRSMDAPMNGDAVNGDWNAVLQPGSYRIYGGSNNGNMPPGAYPYGTLVVFGAGGSIQSRSQLYMEHGGNGQLYSRTAWNGNDWNAWQVVARLADVDLLRSQVYAKGDSDGRYYPRGDIDNAFASRDNNISSRVANRANASQMAAGNALVNNFTSNGNGGYSGYVDVTWPTFNSLSAVVATAQSSDSRGVVAETSNLSNSGCRITLVRPNNTATGVGWAAYGN